MHRFGLTQVMHALIRGAKRKCGIEKGGGRKEGRHMQLTVNPTWGIRMGPRSEQAAEDCSSACTQWAVGQILQGVRVIHVNGVCAGPRICS